jgi:hypothetical protein
MISRLWLRTCALRRPAQGQRPHNDLCPLYRPAVGQSRHDRGRGAMQPTPALIARRAMTRVGRAIGNAETARCIKRWSTPRAIRSSTPPFSGPAGHHGPVPNHNPRARQQRPVRNQQRLSPLADLAETIPRQSRSHAKSHRRRTAHCLLAGSFFGGFWTPADTPSIARGGPASETLPAKKRSSGGNHYDTDVGFRPLPLAVFLEEDKGADQDVLARRGLAGAVGSTQARMERPARNGAVGHRFIAFEHRYLGRLLPPTRSS